MIKKPITIKELKELSERNSMGLVKAVVDIDKGIMAIDAELHADEEALLIKNGSDQYNLWGINLYPDNAGEDFIEFDSMINIRPVQGNRTRGIDNAEIREEIKKIIGELISHE
ncbi:MAG: DUF5674 family protein [Candidatus Saganbacteria bacterium]|nr:DUF5674 family protein [Candidatus Saganbacteria bacterium]